MTIKELIAKLEAYPMDTEIYDIGEDRGHGYSREVVSSIGGIRRITSPAGIVFTIGDEDDTEDKAALLQTYIDMINKQKKGY